MAENEEKPNVVLMMEYYLPHYKDMKQQDKRNYYSSNKFSDYVKYVDTGIKDLRNIDYVEYANNDTKSSGLFNQNGKMTKKQIANLRKHLRETESVIWSGVISFEEEFGKLWCNNYEQAMHILQNELPKFFKKSNFNPDNMEWFAGLHENTDNRHIHFVFFEKKPIRIRQKGEKAYSIGLLPYLSMERFKQAIELRAIGFQAREIKIRTDLIKSVKEELNGISNSKLKKMVCELANKIPQTDFIAYNSTMCDRFTPMVDNITNFIINNNTRIKSYKDDFDELVKQKDEIAQSYCKRNRFPYPIESAGEKLMGDIYRRLGNLIINKAADIRKAKFKRDVLNSFYIKEKRRERVKLSKLLDDCFQLSRQCEYEAIKAFQDYMRKLDEMKIKTMIELGIIHEHELER